MASPLNSSDQHQIQAIDDALNQYIKKAESGSTNQSELSSIEKKLTALAKNPNIPASVRSNLQHALNDLKKVQMGMDIGNLYSAKTQIDTLLTVTETQAEGRADDKAGGGSLGGGGGGEE